MPISIRKFPRAIVHVDGDSFFVSCELASRPDLVGKPVVTGEERGIATAMSPEAKRLGVTRGMPVHQIRREFPSVVILPSDYESYAMYSRRMKDIVLRYTPEVEEYSIDECFADISGLRRSLNMSYEEIAAAIKIDLQAELGMTFSVGLSVTKVLAKVASKWDKPDGLTFIPGYKIEEFLQKLPAKDVWGIGPNTYLYLEKLGIKTALDLAKKDLEFVRTYFTKPLEEIWRELRGEHILQLSVGKKTEYRSIMKTRTFTPASSEISVILAEISRNIESACARLRLHDLYAKEAIFYIKSQDFRHHGLEIKFPIPIATPDRMIRLVEENFHKVYEKGKTYRATGIILKQITPGRAVSPDLFGEFVRGEEVRKIYDEIDALSKKFGQSIVTLGSSMMGKNSTTIHQRKLVNRILPLPLLGKVH